MEGNVACIGSLDVCNHVNMECKSMWMHKHVRASNELHVSLLYASDQMM